jgi:pSer/pThr/pTyr-binding forkhead associated (FHA) protein
MSQLALLVDDVIVQLFPLEKPVVTIGRAPASDIFIDEAGVSTNHAIIRVRPSEFLDGHQELILEDLQSRNGTRVNGRKVSRCQLKPDDVISIAWKRFKLLDDYMPAGETTVLILTD